MKDTKNPIFEAELKQILDDIWKNRTNLDYKNLSDLTRFANKKWKYSIYGK